MKDPINHKPDCQPVLRKTQIIAPVIGMRCMNCGGETEYNDLLSACKKLLEEWDKEENIEHERGSAYHIGIGTGYGICREELRRVVEEVI